MQYNFKEIEDKWQDYWAKNETFKANNASSTMQSRLNILQVIVIK